MVIKENINPSESLIGKLCDFRGQTVLVVKKLRLSFNISDNLKMPQRYEVMFSDGAIDVVSINSLKIIEWLIF